MDTTTHEVRMAHWKQVIEQCSSRPKEQSAKQWLTEHNISEKQYYYWQRKVRARACEEMEVHGLIAPVRAQKSETVFAEIPFCNQDNTSDPHQCPAAIIQKSGATIAVSGDIPEHVLAQIMREVLHA